MSDEVKPFYMRHRPSPDAPWTIIAMNPAKFGHDPFALCDAVRERIYGRPPTAEELAESRARFDRIINKDAYDKLRAALDSSRYR
jgi:hypothetical protein